MPSFLPATHRQNPAMSFLIRCGLRQGIRYDRGPGFCVHAFQVPSLRQPQSGGTLNPTFDFDWRTRSNPGNIPDAHRSIEAPGHQAAAVGSVRKAGGHIAMNEIGTESLLRFQIPEADVSVLATGNEGSF